MIVQDFVNNKENAGTVVVIDLAFNKDLCDPLRKELWRGYIEDTPKEYWPGWMIGQQMPVITVIKSEQKKCPDCRESIVRTKSDYEIIIR